MREEKRRDSMQHTCDCGTCSWCEAKRQVVLLGASRDWKPYQVSPCAWVAESEAYWRIFTQTHTEAELRAVSQGEYQRV